MSEIADKQELSKFAQAVADFKKRLAVLESPAYGAAIARTGDSELMQDYGNTLARARQIDAAIDSVKNAYDGLRDFVGLSAIPLIPIAIVAGITATVLGGIKMIDSFMIRADAKRIVNDNPDMEWDRALELAKNRNQSAFEKTLDTVQLALILGGAFLLYRLVSK